MKKKVIFESVYFWCKIIGVTYFGLVWGICIGNVMIFVNKYFVKFFWITFLWIIKHPHTEVFSSSLKGLKYKYIFFKPFKLLENTSVWGCLTIHKKVILKKFTKYLLTKVIALPIKMPQTNPK